MKVFIILGAINAMLAVGLGAFGAHGLEGKIPDKYLQVWHTGVQYHMYHALGLLLSRFLRINCLASAASQQPAG